MTDNIDARGLSCPQPVLMTKKALQKLQSGTIEILVDNKAASENVARFVQNSGCEVTIDEKEGLYTVRISKGAACRLTDDKTGKEIVLCITSDTIGRGDDELGSILMRGFIPTLRDIENRPSKILFMNSGVKLAAEGSPLLEPLEKLEQEGIQLLVCGTCLDFFNLKEKLKVGCVSNMFEIVGSMTVADSVISL